jgi:ribosome-associated heat shock protein Hsp15
VTDAVRLDKWLWAARFYKTRAAATAAVAGGKVQLNGERPKPAKTLRPGDGVRIRLGPYEHHVVVRGLAEKRGPASAAQRLYEETPESLAARRKGRPTKRDRRDLDRLKGE